MDYENLWPKNQMLVTIEQAVELERLADGIEAIARRMPEGSARGNLFGLAWDVKQMARWGTPSFSV